MTRKEFSSKSEALARATGWCLSGFLVTIIFLAIVGQVLSAFMERHYHSTRWDTTGSLLLLVILFGGLIGITYLEWHLARKWGLICPTCGKRLINNLRQIVLLKDTCPKCQNKVFDDSTVDRSRAFGTTREEFRVNFQNFTRRANRRAGIILIIGFIIIVLGAPMAKYLGNFIDQGGLDWVTLAEWRWFAGILLGAFCLFYLSIFIFAGSRKLKFRCMPCPECGRPLIGQAGKAAFDTGMCLHCGCQLFEVPSPGKV